MSKSLSSLLTSTCYSIGECKKNLWLYSTKDMYVNFNQRTTKSQKQRKNKYIIKINIQRIYEFTISSKFTESCYSNIVFVTTVS